MGSSLGGLISCYASKSLYMIQQLMLMTLQYGLEVKSIQKVDACRARSGGTARTLTIKYLSNTLGQTTALRFILIVVILARIMTTRR